MHGMGCQNGPKNLQGPPNPPCFYFLAANNDDRRTAVLFCRSARPRTPCFLGGTIDEKKRMRCHGMGCENGPKNLQGPQFPNPLFCFGRKTRDRSRRGLFCCNRPPVRHGPPHRGGTPFWLAWFTETLRKCLGVERPKYIVIIASHEVLCGPTQYCNLGRPDLLNFVICNSVT